MGILLLIAVIVGFLFFVPSLSHLRIQKPERRRYKSTDNRFARPERRRTTPSNRRTKKQQPSNNQINNTIRRAKKEQQAANNQSMSRSAQFRCEECGLQLFLSRPLTFHRQSNKFFCLGCYDKINREGSPPQEPNYF